MSSRKRKRGLSDEDRRLWKKVTETVVPMTPLAEQIILEDKMPEATMSTTVPELIPVFKFPPKKSRKIKKAVSSVFAGTTTISPWSFTPALPILPGIDKREKTRLKRGTLALGGRIDLHGMTQIEAHLALRNFIKASVRNGVRQVLVITGKGSRGAEDQFGRSAPGVLKRAVPQWLGQSELRGLVVGFDEAHSHHGGTGAIYVRLKRSDKVK
ncbi:MAG: Smr/MutS family protein [Cohaesibacteraceae bacterium]|nr:Smr/MutS family protein [Cohaesibacteraceae bacterium]